MSRINIKSVFVVFYAHYKMYQSTFILKQLQHQKKQKLIYRLRIVYFPYSGRDSLKRSSTRIYYWKKIQKLLEDTEKAIDKEELMISKNR